MYIYYDGTTSQVYWFSNGMRYTVDKNGNLHISGYTN